MDDEVPDAAATAPPVLLNHGASEQTQIIQTERRKCAGIPLCVCLFDFCSTQTPNSALLFLLPGEDEQKFAKNHRVKQTKPNYPALSEISAFAENRRKI